MIYLLHTDACLRFLNDATSEVVRRLAAVKPVDVALCSIVKSELWHAALRSSRPEENLDVLRRFLGMFQSLPLDDRAAEAAARIRATFDARRNPLGPNDLLVAGVAMTHDLTLVTHNVREFGRIEGLRIEDWE